MEQGEILIGRCKQGRKDILYPFRRGYSQIVPLPEGEHYALNPSCLRDSKGRIVSNLWNFSKVHSSVTVVKYKAFRKVEEHIDEKGEPNKRYWKWRRKGVRSSVVLGSYLFPQASEGYYQSKNCLYYITETGCKYDYLQARKMIYLPLYTKLVKREELFKELKERVSKGENLLIVDPDGPYQESLDYYKKRYGVDEDFIFEDCVKATQESLDLFLNDPRHPFGYGYCLAAALLGIAFE